MNAICLALVAVTILSWSNVSGAELSVERRLHLQTQLLKVRERQLQLLQRRYLKRVKQNLPGRLQRPLGAIDEHQFIPAQSLAERRLSTTRPQTTTRPPIPTTTTVLPPAAVRPTLPTEILEYFYPELSEESTEKPSAGGPEQFASVPRLHPDENAPEQYYYYYDSETSTPLRHPATTPNPVRDLINLAFPKSNTGNPFIKFIHRVLDKTPKPTTTSTSTTSTTTTPLPVIF